MNEKLVTIATYQMPSEAGFARSRLEEAGFKCTLTNENLAALNWILTNAVGGIALQVLESDAERASEILRYAAELQPETLAEPDQDDELIEEGTSAPGLDIYSQGPLEEDEEDYPLLSAREQNADRLFKAALFSMLFPLIFPWAAILLVQVVFSHEPLRGKHKRDGLIGGAITLFALLIFALIFFGDILARGGNLFR